MQNTINQFVNCINLRLENIFKKFDLKTTLWPGDVPGVDVEARSDASYSSVVICFDKVAAISGEWKGYVSANHIEIERIGNTDWYFNDEDAGVVHDYPFSDEESAYLAIEQAISTSPPIHLKRSKHKFTDDATLNATYRELNVLFNGEIPISLHRGERADSIQFEHPRLGSCELIFCPAKVEWSMNGDKPELLFKEADINFADVLEKEFGENDCGYMKT